MKPAGVLVEISDILPLRTEIRLNINTIKNTDWNGKRVTLSVTLTDISEVIMKYQVQIPN